MPTPGRDHDERLEYVRKKLDQLHDLAAKWNNIRHRELTLARQLQERAGEEKRRAERLETQEQFEDAAEARSRQAQFLEEAEALMSEAEEAMSREAETENEEDAGGAEEQAAAHNQNRRQPSGA